MKSVFLCFVSFMLIYKTKEDIKNSRKLFDNSIKLSNIRQDNNNSDDIVVGYYSEKPLENPKNLDLFDISNVVYKVAAERNLKILAQKHDTDYSEYNIKANDENKYDIKVNNLGDNIDFNIFKSKGNLINGLKISDKKYMTGELSSFLKNYLPFGNKTERKLTSKQEKLREVSEGLVNYLNSMNRLNENLSINNDVERAQIFLNEKNVFTILIKGDNDDLELIITNKPNEIEFQDFKINHFEFRRSISLDEEKDNLMAYYKEISDDIIGKISLKNGSSNFVKQIYTKIVIGLDSIFTLIITDKNGLEIDGYITFDIFEKDNSKNKLGEIQIYPIEKESIYGLSLNRSEQTIEFHLPVSELEKSLPNLISTLTDILINKTHKVYDFEAIKDILKSKLAEINCILTISESEKEANISNETFKTGYYQLEDADSSKCEAKGSIFKYELFSYGFLQYFHISIENDLLMDEFMIAVNDKFSDTLNKSLNRFITDIMIAKAAKNQDNVPDTFSYDDISKQIIAKIKPVGSCKIVNNVLICNKIIREMPIEILSMKIFEDNGKNKYYRVSLSMKNSKIEHREMKEDVKEINIPEHDNSAAVQSLISDIENIIKETIE